ARERAGVEGASRDDLRRELERERLRLGVVAADEGVLVGAALRELARGERVETGDERDVDECGALLGEGAGPPRRDLARDREEWRRQHCAELSGGRASSARVRREHDEVDAADGVLVRRSAGRAGLRRLLSSPRRVAGADYDLVARLDEPPREREAEVARTADDRHPHAGTAPSATSASRRRASSSLISVRVTI